MEHGSETIGQKFISDHLLNFSKKIFQALITSLICTKFWQENKKKFYHQACIVAILILPNC